MKEIDKKNLQQEFNIGLKAFHDNNIKEALNKFKYLLSFKKEETQILNLIGMCYFKLKNYRKAEIFISKAMELNPNQLGFIINKGNLYVEQKKYKKALKIYTEGLNYFKNSYRLLYSIGFLYSKQHNYKLAINFYIESLKINSKDKNIYNSLGSAFKEIGAFDKAIYNYKKSISMDNSFSEAIFNLGIIELLQNNHTNSWEKYEYRISKNNRKKLELDKLNIKEWDGSDLNNKSLIIYSEQGIGDAVQFIRFIKLIKKSKVKIILYLNKNLNYLFSKIPEASLIIHDETELFFCNYYISIMSLPYIFRNKKMIPQSYNFFPKNNNLKRIWKKKFDKINYPKVGLMWQGSKLHNQSNYKRSIKLSDYDELLNIKNIKFFSLQKDFGKEQIVNNKAEILDFYNENIDKQAFEDTIEIIKNLDLIITVDTSIAHIAATIGKETWVLLSFVPDFRWGLKEKHTKWYPSVRLYRQNKINSWQNVISEIKNSLIKKFEDNKKLKSP